MYVRKFEADSLEEALSDIKRELGPDAIILKTTSSKGLKGAFMKKRIEITAAISEKSYSKKAKVDTILDPEQKDKFYSNKSSYISNMIDNATGDRKAKATAASGYGKVALNKPVATSAPEMTSSLDHFLSEDTPTKNSVKSFDDFLSERDGALDEEIKIDYSSNYEQTHAQDMEEEEDDFEEIYQPQQQSQTQNRAETRIVSTPDRTYDAQIEAQKSKIDELEKKLFELTRNVQSFNKPEALGIQELMSSLRSLDIEDTFIQKVVRKAHFELSATDKEDADVVFDFALREMLSEINVQMPLFSSVDNAEKKVVTVVISDVTSGQSTMLRKIASLKKDSVIVRNKGSEEFKEGETFSEKFFGIETKVCKTISEIVAATRNSLESKNNVFIDYKAGNQEVNEVKKFIDGLKRSFENVEILVCLSSINSELYNRKVLNRYSSLANGMIVTHLDQCLNFGSLFNLAIDFNKLPYKFFGTGEVVPDDLEAATAERILAGIFQL
ncbi:GTPase [Bacteriovorax sp. Seq25_V]|uniref:GTPase n=1 Tax=Bacteriovorax sp. Seq25_V TaxID=1201288 RepID=UPI000389F81B|nr:GTPase [Bacteriovorax sp. Seq25_V]EQC47484.1 SRP54-type protein, GTPase domain protein [Bacteriovorax sp. Seq25_V]